MNLILFGFKSCGKTTYGQKLSQKLQTPFFDTDQMIEGAVKMSCRKYYEKYGEEAFRAQETKTLIALKSVSQSIIALGGGFVLNPGHLQELYQLGTLVYLTLDFETLAHRILSKSLPAFLNPIDPEGSLRNEFNKRSSLYESICAHRLPLFGKNDETILDELTSILQRGSHG